MGNFYVNGIFSSFEELRSKFNLQPSDLFRYFQIRHSLKSNTPSFPNIPPLSGIDLMHPLLKKSKRHISFLYDLLAPDSPPALARIKTDWETKLGITLDEDLWSAVLREIKSCSSSVRLQVIQFKTVHRAHYSKTRLAKIYPGTADVCDRCSQSPCNHTHMFWSCPRLVNYWKSYFTIISDILGHDIELCPHIAIFGVPKPGMKLSTKQKNIVSFTSLIARRKILLLWKNKAPPLQHLGYRTQCLI